jgi:uncharacterized coiled-coil protein SlyX
MPENTAALIQRIDEMEIKITLLEQANEEMSEVILAQQTSIDVLTRQLDRARAQMERFGEPVDTNESPPPHY